MSFSIVKKAVVAVVLSAFAYVTRPVWHPLFMLFYTNPAIVESAILAYILSLPFSRYSQGILTVRTVRKVKIKVGEGVEDVERRKRNVIERVIPNPAVFTILFTVILFILLPAQGLYTPLYLSHNLRYEKVGKLPEVDPAVVRIVPKVVADKYAMDALQFPRYTIDRGAIVFVNGTPYWGYGLIPEGLVNSFVLKDKGAIYVDMSAFGKKTEIVEKSMEVGEGMYLTDNYLWQIYSRKYTVDCEKPYFVPYDGRLYMAVPAIGYELHFRFPVFFTTPVWAGVFLISQNGSVRFLTSKQAEKCRILAGQKLFPAELAREYIDSFNYIHGILNVLLYHRDQFEIADVPGQSNQQPFLIATKQGLKWIIACEPYGQSYGIFRIYIVDARTGEIQLYQPSSTKALIGPVRAVDYVKQAMPKVDWQTMKAVEPIPVVVNGTLYWQVRIIPSDASGIAYVAMVNAENPNDVIVLRSYSEVKAFLEKGENFTLNSTTGTSKKVSRGIAYYLVIKKNGVVVRRIPVYVNESVEVLPAG